MISEISEHNKHHIDRLTRLHGGEALSEPFQLCGISRAVGHEEHMIGPDEIPAMVARIVDDLWAQRSHVTRDHAFRPLTIEQWGYGTHFVDSVFGAEVTVQPDGNSWSKVLTSEVGTLEQPDVMACPEVLRMLAVYDELVRVVQRTGEMYITLGVLSCTLNIAINLYGERFLMALLSDPEAAEHDARVITDTIISLHRLFRSRIPSELAVLGAASIRFMPPGGGLIDGCATQLLSAATYRKLIAPYDNRLMDIYPTGCLMHLCGASEQHIPTFREMPKLKAVQLNDRATEAFEQYYAGLREDQILYVIPTANVSIESVLRVSNGGKRIVIVADTPRNSN